MPGTTPTYGWKYALAGDEVKAYPAEVDESKTKEIEKIVSERTIAYKTHAVSFEAASGELAECTKAITVTLPAATVNRLIGVVSIPAVAGELVKITTSGGAFIIGDFITAASKTATITLTEGQHVLLFASGTNWFIIAGEPKREQKWELKTFTKAELEAGVEFSASRPAALTGVTTIKVGKTWAVGGAALGELMPTYVPPGQKLVGEIEVANGKIGVLLL